MIRGEIRYLTDGIPVIEGIFEDAQQAEFIAAQWHHTALTTNITEKFTAQKLISMLCSLRKTDNEKSWKSDESDKSWLLSLPKYSSDNLPHCLLRS